MPKDSSIEATTLLKGLAIVAVVLLHTLSSFPPIYFENDAFKTTAIIIDQLLRFCVPFFIAISGFSLMKRYENGLALGEYLYRRIWKLLPLYLLWSISLHVTLGGVPGWHEVNSTNTFVHQLIFGQVDYQLYFVPLIISLYLLFPLLRLGVKFSPLLTGIAALFFQIVLFGWFQKIVDLGIKHPFLTDQRQYILAFSWIFYFVLGMVFAHQQISKNSKNGVRLIGLALIVVGLCWSYNQAFGFVAIKPDLIAAQRFTRYPILLYASGTLVFVFASISAIPRLFGIGKQVFLWLGKNSFTIFLAHTLLLRIIFSGLLGLTEGGYLVFAFLMWGVTWFVTKRYFASG